MNKQYKVWLLICGMLFSSLARSLPLELLKLPPHFKINIYAYVANAREMTLGDNGIVYVGSLNAGKVYAILPNKERTQANKVIVIAQNLRMSNGVAYHHGSLFVAAVNRILRFDDIEAHLDFPPTPVEITDQLPDESTHGWRYIAFGPDGKLYIGIGAPCNVCISQDPRFATIMRMQPDASQLEVYAKGIRNTVGFDWNPVTQQLWFTENGRDWLGNNLPPDELNMAPEKNMNFGFPYFYGNNQPDPSYGKLRSSSGMTEPILNLPAHVAPLGMVFYTGKQFPAEYYHQIFIAEHGSWNRTQKIGYQVILVKINGDKVITTQPFITGWLQGGRSWGRPVALLVLTDGSMLLSDDENGVIYRISYADK